MYVLSSQRIFSTSTSRWGSEITALNDRNDQRNQTVNLGRGIFYENLSTQVRNFRRRRGKKQDAILVNDSFISHTCSNNTSSTLFVLQILPIIHFVLVICLSLSVYSSSVTKVNSLSLPREHAPHIT